MPKNTKTEKLSLKNLITLQDEELRNITTRWKRFSELGTKEFQTYIEKLSHHERLALEARLAVRLGMASGLTILEHQLIAISKRCAAKT